MKIPLFFCIVPIIFPVTMSFAHETDENPGEKVLLLSDKTDKPARFFLDAFTEELTDAGYDFTEAEVAAESMVDLGPYTDILLYSQVMAFNSISPVSAWVKAQASLKGKKLYLFVTANRWFFKSRLEKLRKLVLARGGVVVDAVTMATHGMTDDEKREAVDSEVKRIR